ncbi:MAG: sigma-70 family RNA polymerase sigma factor [Clostridia bacterium]|nr:sigma-70 family RNA polymerase sigma factor [Clostridia bacterium]
MLFAFPTALDPETEKFLARMIERYGDRLTAVAYSLLGNREDAEEAVSDTFMEAFRHIEDFRRRPEGDIIRLLVIYTKNNAKDRLRKRKGKRTLSTDALSGADGEDGNEGGWEIPDDSAIPENIVLNEERARRIASYIDRLSGEQHDVIILRYYYGMSIRAAAQRLKISETAVNARLTRAKAALKKMMKEGEFDG